MTEESVRKDSPRVLSAGDLLSGSGLIQEVEISSSVLAPGSEPPNGNLSGIVRLRALSVEKLGLISKASRQDVSLVPLLIIKEALVEPTLSLEEIRNLNVGLVHFLVSRVNAISGLGGDGEALHDAVRTPLGRAQILLAKHFGWTPEQVGQLTPGQVAVYLAGIEKLMQMERTEK